MEADDLPARLISEMRSAAGVLRSAGSVLVISHIDADGITAGSIASETLRRIGKKYTLRFVKSITDDIIAEINSSPEDAVWICDLGSAYISRFTRENVIITDHHVPDPDWRSGQTSLMAFNTSFQLNPHLYGLDGSYEICGAGMTYFLSYVVDPANRDLAYLAIVGAIGDFQDDRECRLVGWNRVVLGDAVAAGDVEVSAGIRYFGRESRPLVKFLEYGDSPSVPGITGNEQECTELLSVLDIPLFREGRPRTWNDLDAGEKERLQNALTGALGGDAGGLIGEIYSVTRYPPGSGMHDAKEFSTTLNSCGRYDDAETGARICAGDPEAMKDAERHRREHRKNISSAMELIRSNHLMRTRSNLQYFDAGDAVRDTVVGIVAGMVL